ncbi:MAG: hypothetical protein GX876_12780 [Bacteroidales bacterium]|nr:hypothetical protein [Bacteroidales bacterium]
MDGRRKEVWNWDMKAWRWDPEIRILEKGKGRKKPGNEIEKFGYWKKGDGR